MIARRKPLQRHTPLPRRSALLKRLGKKGKAWAKVRRQLKEEFLREGITLCEVCSSDFQLGFAHRLKRRFITTPDELQTVALLCVNCHNRIEILPHPEMFGAVTGLIASRSIWQELL